MAAPRARSTIKKARDLTEKFDRSLSSFAWAPTSNAICFAAEDHGEAPIYSVAIENDQPSEIARLHADDLTFGANGALYFTRMSIAAPNEIWRLEFMSDKSKHDVEAVTHMKDRKSVV